MLLRDVHKLEQPLNKLAQTAKTTMWQFTTPLVHTAI